jgi:hypothetical protein
MHTPSPPVHPGAPFGPHVPASPYGCRRTRSQSSQNANSSPLCPPPPATPARRHTSKNLDSFADSFKDGFYCDRDAIKEAMDTSLKMFNIIDHATGYKADFVVLKNEEFRQEEFNRRVQVDYFGKTIYVVSPEDLLID